MQSKKVTQFVAVSAIALFLGATSTVQVHAQVQPVPVDSDGDTYADDVDECDASILPAISPTILINGVDTGIRNTEANATGCTLADQIEETIDVCLDGAKNHGKFVSCVSHEMNILKRAKTITGKQKGKIQSIVAKMR